MSAPAGWVACKLLPTGALFACGSSPARTDVTTPDGGDTTRGPAGDDASLEGDAGESGAGHDASADAGDDALTSDDAGDADLPMDADGPVDASGPPFACGPTLLCPSVTMFCGQVTGPHGGTFYDCDPAPSSCATDVSCACLLAQGIVSPCSVLDGGGVLVVAQEP